MPDASPLLRNQNWFLFTFAFYLIRCSESGARGGRGMVVECMTFQGFSEKGRDAPC